MKAADRVLSEEDPFDGLHPNVSHSAAVSAVHLAALAGCILADSGWGLQQAVEHTDEFLAHVKETHRRAASTERVGLLSAICRSILTDAEEEYPLRKEPK